MKVWVTNHSYLTWLAEKPGFVFQERNMEVCLFVSSRQAESITLIMKIDQIKKDLELEFPQYQFSIVKRIYGKCIITKKSKYSGADIYVKENRIIVEPGVPEMKTRLLIGGGAVLLKMFRKDFNEPALEIAKFLEERSQNVELKK